jgi:hypothetical protein
MNMDKDLEKTDGNYPRFQNDKTLVNYHCLEFHGNSSSAVSGFQHMRAKELHCP